MNPVVQSLIRHILTSAGGALVAKGVLTTALVDESIGAIITLVGVIWSILSKRKSDKE